MSSTQLIGFMQRSAWFSKTASPRLGAVLMLALLAGCEGDVTMDLTTEQPADPTITQVVADVRGLEFRTSGGGTETLEFTDSQQLDFMLYADDADTLRLFTSEEMSEGTYTGVRLLFDEDRADEAFVTDTDGTEFPMTLAEGDYASLAFELEDRESNSESFTLMLDLRQSLTFDDDSDEYTFTPVLRAVASDDISSIEGNVAVNCPAGDTIGEGAVYLFQGNDVTPDDLDASGVEPFATAPVLTSADNSSFFYSLRVLPEGDYTLALTCIGNDEDAATDEDLEFRNIINVELDNNEAQILDLP
jgi:hypothetical protein